MNTNWQQWCNKQRGEQDTNTILLDTIKKFNEKPTRQSTQSIKKLNDSLNRANALIQASNSTNQKECKSSIENIRDNQFCFLMSWNAIEILSSSLSNAKNNAEKFLALIDHCELKNEFKPFKNAWKKYSGINNIDGEVNLETNKNIVEYLYTNDTNAKTLTNWFVHKKDITDYKSFYNLAKAVRNSTVHGNLSPTGVKKLKLQKFLLMAINEFSSIFDRFIETLLTSD